MTGKRNYLLTILAVFTFIVLSATSAFAVDGTTTGDMLYWSEENQQWEILPAPKKNKQRLSFCNGIPKWTDEGCVYAIGDTGPAGGIVFYIEPGTGGRHGLEASPEDLPGNYIWPCSNTLINGANRKQMCDSDDGYICINPNDGKPIYEGPYNTADMLRQDCRGDTAGKACDEYSLNGYDDWFLPSIAESRTMFKNLHLQGLGNFRNDGYYQSAYWSSSQADDTSAIMVIFCTTDACRDQYITTNEWEAGTKSDDYYVRAARIF